MTGIRTTGAIVLLFILGTCLPLRADHERIVSVNLGTDQLLLQLVEPERIAALSFFAADSQLSVLADRAQGIPGIQGTAEEVLRLEPDLLLAGEYGHRPTAELAERLGIRVLRLPIPNDFEDVRAVLTRLGAELGAEERAGDLIAEMDERLAALNEKTAQRPERPTALAYGHGGYAHGAETMMDAVIEAAGFRNLGRELGIAGQRKMTLEEVLLNPPDFLISTRYHPDHPTLGDRLASHRALRSVAGRMHRLEIPLALINASNNLTVAAAEALYDQAQRHLP